jgi:hypothetical protein
MLYYVSVTKTFYNNALCQFFNYIINQEFISLTEFLYNSTLTIACAC